MRDSRGPLRDVAWVGVHRERVRFGYKYALRLECGHTVQRKLLRGNGDVRTHCSACLIESVKAHVAAYRRGEVQHNHLTHEIVARGKCPACDAHHMLARDEYGVRSGEIG